MAYPQVVVIGAATIDTKGRVLSPLAPGTSTPGQIRVSVGGVGRNIAENLARLGVSTALLSAVGDDATGRRILQRTQEGGVDTDQVLVRPNSRSGAYVAVMDENGAPYVSVDDLEIIQSITRRYVYARRSLIANAEIVIFDANLSPETIETTVNIARKNSVLVSADTVSVGLAQRLKPVLSSLHLLAPNSTEATALTGVPAADRNGALLAAKTLVRQGIHIVVVTMAELGVCYATSETSGHIPAVKTDVVDFTGGGDALHAALVFGLLQQMPIDEAVRLGVAAAALTLQCRDTVCPDISLDHIYDRLAV